MPMLTHELAALTGIDDARIQKACEAGLFKHARKREGEWHIPLIDVSHCLLRGAKVQQLYTLREFAALLSLSYSFIHKATKRAVGDAAPRLKTITVFGQIRIPEEEYWRVTGLKARKRR